MYQLIYPALICATALFYAAPAASNPESAAVQPLTSVAIQHNSSDWKQANQKVAELGGWQFYASEAGGHQGMDHSGHSMPMEHSPHHSHQQMEHSDQLPAKTGDEHEHHH